jgi:dTDP-4-amino-4,6-dideoxygalactose transaminase
MSYYRGKYGFDERQFPCAAQISERSIALPVGPHLDADDAAYLLERIADAMEGVRA